MTRLFTDEEGKRFEAIEPGTAIPYSGRSPDLTDYVYIKPVKAVEVNRYNLVFGQRTTDIATDLTHIDQEYTLTEPTAQKVAEAIEALMEYVTEPEKLKRDIGMTVIADRARAAFQRDA